MTLKEKVKRTIERHRMLSRGDTVLVGVSGGPDSMALLYLLMGIRDEYRISMKVAHLNHGFRKEAAEEAEFVRKEAESLNLPVIMRYIDVPSIKEKEGLSAQEAARKVRYDFFRDAAGEGGADKVALAHTADDQAETVLIRLLRGSGPLGLSGIPPVRTIISREPGVGSQEDFENRTVQLQIIRPLIDSTREEIESYLSEKGIPFVTDSSNIKMDYLRNRVRMELIPFLEGYNPNIKETLIRTAELAQQDNGVMDAEAGKVFKSLIPHPSSFIPDNEDITMNFKDLKALHPAISSRIIRKAIKTVKGDLRRISNQHISDIMNLIDSGEGRWSLHLPDVTVTREHDRVIFKKESGRR